MKFPGGFFNLYLRGHLIHDGSQGTGEAGALQVNK